VSGSVADTNGLRRRSSFTGFVFLLLISIKFENSDSASRREWLCQEVLGVESFSPGLLSALRQTLRQQACLIACHGKPTAIV
jgi:hypothetical protein